MPRTLRVIFAALLTSGSTVALAQVSVSATDLQPLIGSWQGTVTYLDYTSNKPYVMPATLLVEQVGRTNRYLFTHAFPNEPNADWTDTVVLSDNGTMINDQTLTSKRILDGGTQEITTEVLSVDGNDRKPALLRHTYTIGKTTYVHRKEVQFAGDTTWIVRHEYNYPVRAK